MTQQMERAPAASITVGDTEYTINHMGVKTYRAFRAVADKVDIESDLDSQSLDAVLEAVTTAFNGQFTKQDLIDNDVDVVDLYAAFIMIDVNLAQNVGKRMESIAANFTTGN